MPSVTGYNDTAAVRRAVAAIAAAGGTLLFPWIMADGPAQPISHCTVFLAHDSKILGSLLFDDGPLSLHFRVMAKAVTTQPTRWQPYRRS